MSTHTHKTSTALHALCICALLTMFVMRNTAHAQNAAVKPRMVITCDPELDDNNSLIRFLLYSSDVQVEGLIYASSGFHWKGDGKGTKWFVPGREYARFGLDTCPCESWRWNKNERFIDDAVDAYASSGFHWKGDGKGTKWFVPGREYARFGLDTCPCESWRWSKNERFIDDAVDAYAKVYANLKIHNPDYPAPGVLKSKIRYGNIEFDGDISKDSPGSDLIKSLMLDDKPGKLFITAWGGQSTIARALKSIQEQYEYTSDWEQIKKKIARKVVLLPSGDQDDTYAKYIKPNWPDIEYREFHDGPNYGYGAQLRAKPEDAVYLTSAWMTENITSRGPLGSLYRVWGDGKQMVKGDKMDYFGFSGYTDEQLRKMGYVVWMPVQPKGSWLGEGDNPTFMNMLDNGLRAYEAGYYGGWGGREVKNGRENFSFNMSDTSQKAMAAALSAANSEANKSADEMAFPDFFPAAENDFAARLQWSVTNKYADANHAPVVTVEGPLHIMVSAGEKIRLNANVSDPDGNTVSVKWWQFRVGSFPGEVVIDDADSLQTHITIPKDAKAGQTIHIILEARDNGSPNLTSYQRVIVTVR